MEEKVISIIKNVLEMENVDITTSQENCEKWDSMALLNIVVDIQDEFDLSFEPEEISSFKSVRSIVDAVSAKQ